MKIAFATSDGVHLDQQFRRASRVVVYELGPDGPRLDGAFEFPPDRAVKTEERLRAIRGAAIVFGTAFGPSSAARIAARGIRPATAPAGTRIADLLAQAPFR
jgi:nitrogen fixation protein NifX